MAQNSTPSNSMQALTHPHAHTSMTDATSATSDYGHEQLRDGLSRRQHRPAEPERPVRGLSAGSHSSTMGGRLDRDVSSDGERRVPVDVHTATSDGDHLGCDGGMRLTAVKGVSCSHSVEWQHFDNTHHISNLPGENVNPNEQPRHRKVIRLLRRPSIVV